MDEITVAPALETEAAACLALLQDAVGWPVELLIAKRGHAIVGAAALRWRNESDPPGFPLALHVLPPERRRGIGRRLLDAAIDLACEETPGLWSLSYAVAGTAAADFLSACGFTPKRREHHFEAAIDALLADVGPRANRLRDRGRVSEEVRIVPLSEAPLDDVGRLLAKELGAAASVVVERLGRRVSAPEETGDRSRVALRGDRVEGAILWQVRDGVALVEARVVHPSSRGGWLNVALLEDGLIRGRAEGLERLRFHCGDTVRDTLSLARRCDATEMEVRAYYYLAVDE